MKYKPDMTPEEKELFCLECLIAFNVACRNSLHPKYEDTLRKQYNMSIMRLIQKRNALDKTEQPYYGA